MNTVINTKLYGPDAQNRFEDFLKVSPELSNDIIYDQTTGVVLVHYTATDLVETILKYIGGKYPTAFMVVAGSEDERTVREVYANLSEIDKPFVEIVPAFYGCRVSVFIDQPRYDIQERFWSALYPKGTDSTRIRGGRTRDYAECNHKLPESMKATAMRVGDWSHMVVINNDIYVSQQLYIKLEEEYRKAKTKSRLGGRTNNPRSPMTR